MRRSNAGALSTRRISHTMPESTRSTALLHRLPARVAALLRTVGRLADAQGVKVYLVGGVVRDLLLRRVNLDLDLAAEGDGIALARRVSARFRTNLTVFDRFATARLQFPNGLRMDIATMRRESYALPAELPEVEPASLAEDLYRRDFTINAMAIELNAKQAGQLIDWYGGQKDLRTKTIRVLHNKSFHDDPTRIFRAIRFEQRFKGRLDPPTARLLRKAAATNLIDRLSGSRLCNEWFLLFAERDPLPAMDRLGELKLFRFLHPHLRYGARIRKVIRILPKAFNWWARRFPASRIDRAVLYLMALLEGADEPDVEGVVTRLMLSNEQARKVRSTGKKLAVIARRLARTKGVQPSEVYHLLIALPDEALVLLLAKAAAGTETVQTSRTRERVFHFVTRLRDSKTALRGDDLLRMGMEPGPQIRELLGRLLDAQLDGKVKTTNDERSFVRTLLSG